MQGDSLYPGHQAEIAAFLETHRPAIADLVEKVYLEVGGHYAQMTSVRRRQQALIDAGEIVNQMSTGEVNQVSIAATLTSIQSLAILTDIVRMSEVIERLMIALAEQQLAGDPELCRKVSARISNTSRRFRMNLTAAYAELVRVRIDTPTAE